MSSNQVAGWRELFHTFEEFECAPPLQFAINDFLQEAGVTLIGGLSGHGKTLIMLSIARALLEETPLFGWNLFSVPRPSARVLYLTPECAIGPFNSRIKLFKLQDHVWDDRLLVRTLSVREDVPLTDPRILRAAEGADIFLDTAIRFIDGAENDSESAKAFADTLFRLLAVGARTITGAHHAPKSFSVSDRMSLENILRGSSDIGAMLTTAWGIRQIDSDRNRIYVQNVKSRDFEPCAPFVIEGRPHLDKIGDFLMVEPPGTAMEMKRYMAGRMGAPLMPGHREKTGQAVSMKAQGMSLREIAGRLGVSKSWVEKCVKGTGAVN
jgi:hypothetical protein